MPTVYWAPACLPEYTNSRYSLAWDEPTSLFKEISLDFKEKLHHFNNLNNFLMCPSVRPELTKTYIIKSPIDYSILWDGKNITTFHYDQTAFDSLVRIRNLEFGMMSLGLELVFFCDDDSLEVTQLPPYFSTADLNVKTRRIPGRYDIATWFRPMDVPLIISNPNELIKINREDPLYYLRFETEEKINFERFVMTTEIYSVLMSCAELKLFIKNLPLADVYTRFRKARAKHLLLKLIKNQLKE